MSINLAVMFGFLRATIATLATLVRSRDGMVVVASDRLLDEEDADVYDRLWKDGDWM